MLEAASVGGPAPEQSWTVVVVQSLIALVTRLWGSWMTAPAFGALTWADVAVLVCVAGLALLAHAAVALLVRLGRRMAAVPAADLRTLGGAVLCASGGPLSVLIWVCGIWFAVAPLLLKLDPDSMRLLQVLGRVILGAAIFFVFIWLILRLTRALEDWLVHWAPRTQLRIRLDDLLRPLIGRSLRIIAPVLGITFALPVLNLPARPDAVVLKGTSILFIVAFTAILFQTVNTGKKVVMRYYDIKAADNLRARTVYTQVRVIGRIIDIIIGLFALAAVLMLFSEVRHVGASLLASAGVVGVIAGFAAQKTIGNLFAGFHIALAQPMRLDDVVIVEGEWGRIEEITLTYVVVRIWDDRRMVVPLSYFLEKPFQNWTRTSAGLLGSVIIWVDYSFPVDEARAAVKQIVESSPLWDRRFWNLQVSDASEHCMQLRVLATSADSSASWDLRCEIREKFIACIQERWPHTLPKVRLQTGTGLDRPLTA